MKSKWTAFAAVILISFAILGWAGVRIYQTAPPIPAEVRTDTGDLVMTGADIQTGQNVWQSMGGMEQGSIWGHGSYVAPDWTADWLHRESVNVLDDWSVREHGQPYDALAPEAQAALRQRLVDESARLLAA
jgi:nitric oxide reductase subunit B